MPGAPPAAPPRKSLASHTPRHAAGRPRTAKARAVWQPRRAPPRHENSPVSRTPHAAHPSPRRPRRREKSGQTPDRMHPVPKHAPPPVRAGGAFPVCPFRSFLQHEPQRAIARTAPHDRQNNSARPSARHIAAQSPVSHTARHAAPPAAPPRKSLASHTPRHAAGRPRTAKARAIWQPHRAPPRRENSPVSRTPRTIALSAAPQKTLGPAAMPGAPPQPRRKNNPAAVPQSQSARPRPYGRGRVSCLSVSFLPPTRAAAHNRKGKRRTIAKTTARYGMGRSAARMVSGEHRKSRSARPQEPPRSRPRQAAPVQSAASSSALGS